MDTDIVIHGIETNNLKNIDVKIKKHSINLIIGPSGSGKSSLAYDTIAQIGQHEFFSMFADNFNEPSYKVKSYKNMEVTVPIKQVNHNNNIRSTIGTYFGLNNIVGLIYAVVFNKPRDFFVLNKDDNLCEQCHGLGFVKELDYNKIVDFNISLNKVPFKCWKRNKDFFSQIITNFCNDYNIDPNKTFRELTEKEKKVLLYGESIEKYSIRYKKNNGYSRRTTKYYGVLTNTPMLPNYNVGLAYYSEVLCKSCGGKRFSKSFDEYQINGHSIGELMTMDFITLKQDIKKIHSRLLGTKLDFLYKNLLLFIEKAIELNLGYLSLNRSIPTLSGGELQRLRMVQVFTTQLSNLLIVLDEPLAGLSGNEKKSIYDNIVELSNLHTIVVVDHGSEFYPVAKQIIALGETGGINGGYLIDEKKFLEKQKNIVAYETIKPNKQYRVSLTSEVYSYKGVEISIADNCMNLVTGSSGVGKSTLLREYFPQFFEKYFYINQKPLMGNKNSNVATVLDISSLISNLYAFYFNKENKFFSNLTGNAGMCPKCMGAGYIEYGKGDYEIAKVECSDCEGTGFNKSLKKYKIDGKSILDVWKMTIDEGVVFFENHDKKIVETCILAQSILLGHLQIGQLTSTLSGGENIRIKILKAHKSMAKIIGIDEPFRGLSFIEVDAVARFIERLRQKDKTIVIVDHTSNIEQYFSQCIKLICKDNILMGRILSITS